MERYIVFLKGVNVGASTKVSMPVLRLLLTEKLGTPVTTYINSGNLVLDSDLTPTGIRCAVEGVILSSFSVATTAVPVTSDDLRRIHHASPFSSVAHDKAKSLVYFFDRSLDDQDLAAAAASLQAGKGIVEPLSCARDALYAYYPQGVGSSKLTTAYIDKVLGLSSTGRNLRTLDALLGL